MDFQLSSEHLAFRDSVADFVAREVAPRVETMERTQTLDMELFGRIGALGYFGLRYPEEYGGANGDALMFAIMLEEFARGYLSLAAAVMMQCLMGTSFIFRYGTAEQKARLLVPAIRGEKIGTIAMTEPNAGSDLAGLRTTAVRDGDEWVVNGQKVWNSGAHYSGLGILLTRTDPDAPKHRGITYFLVDMATPGIEVRPLRQITGAAHFNEVFLTDVRIPDENVLGAPNAGWGPILTTLANERTLIGGSQSQVSIRDFIALARHFGVAGDPVIRQELARLEHAFACGGVAPW